MHILQGFQAFSKPEVSKPPNVIQTEGSSHSGPANKLVGAFDDAFDDDPTERKG